MICTLIVAQTHQHDHAGHDHGAAKPIEPPKIFLDKSLRIVQYQLNRLDNERLLLVERKTDDLKYAPVYSAILTRAGMSPQYREEALEGLRLDQQIECIDGIIEDPRNDRRHRSARTTNRSTARWNSTFAAPRMSFRLRPRICSLLPNLRAVCFDQSDMRDSSLRAKRSRH